MALWLLLLLSDTTTTLTLWPCWCYKEREGSAPEPMHFHGFRAFFMDFTLTRRREAALLYSCYDIMCKPAWQGDLHSRRLLT